MKQWKRVWLVRDKDRCILAVLSSEKKATAFREEMEAEPRPIKCEVSSRLVE